MFLRGKLALAVGTLALQSSFAFAVTLQEVQKAMTDNKDAHWVAGDTHAIDMLGVRNRSNPFGYIYEQPNLDLIKTDGSHVKLPSSIDWRNHNGQNFMSPIKNQANCGSCVAFAAVGTLEGTLNVAAKSAVNLDLSEQYLFSNIGACEQGSTPDEATSSLQSEGIPDEVCDPYISGRDDQDHDTSIACADHGSRTFKINSSKSVFGATAVKQALQNGPVMTTMQVYDDFMYYTGGVYKHVTGDVDGGHAIVIVGYDDAQSAWIVRNSWGPEWGENGYFRIAYSDVSGVGQIGYQMNVSAPNVKESIASPNFLDAVSKTLMLTVAPTSDAKVGAAGYTLTNVANNSQSITGQTDPTRSATAVNVGSLADGLYQLEVSSGATGEMPRYSMVVVANQQHTVNATLVPDFPANQPVKDRITFKVNFAGDIPLTGMEVFINQVGGSYTTTRSLDNPGASVDLGWRTTTAPNGTYEIYAVGKLGNLASYQSSKLTVTVQN